MLFYFWQIQLWKVRKVDPTFLLHRPSALQKRHRVNAGCQASSYWQQRKGSRKFSLGRLKFQSRTFWMKVVLWFNHSKWFTRPAFSSCSVLLSISISFFANVHRRSVDWQAEQKPCLPTLEQMDDWKKLSWINTFLNKPLSFRCGNLMIHSLTKVKKK